MESILLAVAIHDGRPHLDDVAPARMVVRAGEALHVRIAYSFTDQPRVREDAILHAEVHLDRKGPWRASAAMHDRPLVRDDQGGQLSFDLPALQPGPHTLGFKIRFETSRQQGGLPHLQRADLEKEIRIEAT